MSSLPRTMINFKIISQKYSPRATLLKLLKWFCSDKKKKKKKMAARAKKRKILNGHLLLGQWLDFKIISQKFSSWVPVPKLLK